MNKANGTTVIVNTMANRPINSMNGLPISHTYQGALR